MRRFVVLFIVGALFPAAALAQQTGQIAGTVTDAASGEALVGVAVTVEGTLLRGVTGEDGQYSIDGLAPGTYQLSAGMLGYAAATAEDVEVTAGGVARVNLALQLEAIALEEVVVVGYGQQQRVNVTGAVASVESTRLTAKPIARITEALQGATPGLTIMQRSAQPGEQDIQFNIRGRNSLGDAEDTQPLVLIDDVPGDINQINPNDIESISVLKDASSTAIYGSRGANGVILVTTKRGSQTGGLQMTYDGYYGIQDVATFPEAVGPRDYLGLINEARTNRGLEPTYSDEYIENTVRALEGDPSVDPLQYPWTDWLDVVFDPAPIQEHSFGVRGGNELARFNLSLNYFDQQGMTPQTEADRLGMRLNTDFNVTERLSAGLDLSLRRTSDAEPNGMDDLTFRMFHDTPPTTVAQYPDGTYGWSPNGHNPLAYGEAWGRVDDSNRHGTINARANYRLFDNFTIRTLASAQLDSWESRNWRNEGEFLDYWNPEIVRKSIQTNRLDQRKSNEEEIHFRVMGQYDQAFGAHGISGTIGYEQTANDWEEIRAIREGFYSNNLQEINIGDADREETWGTSSEWSLRSGFGRLSYNFDDRYLLEANARYDGSSRFAKGNRFGFFPSFSAAWRISEESFFRDNIGAIDELKLRASWGRTGNQAIGNYEYWQTYALGAEPREDDDGIPDNTYIFGEQLITAAAQMQLANEEISWETTEMTNLGIDLTLLSGRLAITGDIYRNDTRGILLDLPIPRTLGLGPTFRSNAGKVRNQGWETSVTWRDRFRDVDYSLGFNIYDNRNEVLDLADTGPYIDDDRWLTAEGYPLGTMWGYEADGLFVDQADVDSHADQSGLSPDTGPGDIKFRDLNGDGVINENDRTAIGNDLPRYTIGSNLTAAWRGFDVGLFFQGVLKVDAYPIGALIEGPVWENFTTVEWLDRWTEENPDPNAKRPKPSLNLHHNHGPVSSFWVQDVSYVKLKTAQIGYTLRRSPGPSMSGGLLDRAASVLPLLDFSQVRFYISGQNLLTFANSDLFLDPEFPSGRGTVYPQTRTFSFGTSIQF